VTLPERNSPLTYKTPRAHLYVMRAGHFVSSSYAENTRSYAENTRSGKGKHRNISGSFQVAVLA